MSDAERAAKDPENKPSPEPANATQTATETANAKAAGAPPLKDSAKTAGYGLFFYGAAYFAGAFFHANPLGAAGVQAAIAEWSTGTLGVAWSEGTQTIAQVAKRAVIGAVGGGVSAAVACVLAVRMYGARVAHGGSIRLLGIAFVTSALLAARDELFLRGLVLRVLAKARREAQLVACGLASVASAIGAADTSITPLQMAVAGITGVAFGALWQGDRGAWMAWGAHAAWLAGITSVATSPDTAPSPWTGGENGLEAGLLALPVAAMAAAAAVAWSVARRARAS